MLLQNDHYWTYRYKMAINAQPMTHCRSECAMQRANGSPAFVNVEPHATGGELLLTYPYESRSTAVQVLGHLSDVLEVAQRIRLSKTPFVSVQADGSTDKGKLHNLTIDVTYWDDSIGGVRTEFLKIICCKGTAEATANTIIETLRCALGPEFAQQFIGGSFDGASVMMGERTGVQKRLRNLFPRAFFIHCVAHRGALVVRNSSGEVDEIDELLASILPSIYNLICNASTRAEYLEDAERKHNEPTLQPLPLSDTRWLSASEVSNRLERIIVSVVDTIRTFKDESDELTGLHMKLSSFEYIALIHIMPCVLNVCSNLSKTFQAKETMIGEITGHIQDFKASLLPFSSQRNGNVGFSDWVPEFAKELTYRSRSVL